MSKDYSKFSKEELIGYIKELQSQLKKDKYGLSWDKDIEVEHCLKNALNNIPYLLRDNKHCLIKSSVDNNILIEGDNYDVLNILKMSNGMFFDCIYIDPPYNTGNRDFKYNDMFVDKEDGYRHSKWLNFMSLRLGVARELLTDTGVMFISIDEHEIGNLKLLCDKIFGYDNVDILVWQKTDPKVDRNTNSKTINRFNNFHEYIVVCYKNKKDTSFNKIKKLPEWKQKTSNPDNDPRGNWQSGIMSYEEGHKNEDISSPFYYEITLPSGKKMKRHWFFTKKQMYELLKDNRIYFPKKGDGVPRLKTFENEEREYFMTSILTGLGTSSTAKDEILKIFGDREQFNTPKPVKLIKELIRATTSKTSNVLDFFAGSGTTGQAVLELNNEDGGHRKFVLCTNNENNICSDIAYSRLKTVITGNRQDGSRYSDGIPANLIYYKTGFIRDNNNTDQAKYCLVEKVDEILCMIENVFIPIERDDYSAHYVSNDNTKHMFIYSEYYNDIKFNEFRNRVLNTEGYKVVYIYSSENDDLNRLFEDATDIEIKSIPAKIYDIYKEIVEDIKRGCKR